MSNAPMVTEKKGRNYIHLGNTDFEVSFRPTGNIAIQLKKVTKKKKYYSLLFLFASHTRHVIYFLC